MDFFWFDDFLCTNQFVLLTLLVAMFEDIPCNVRVVASSDEPLAVPRRSLTRSTIISLHHSKSSTTTVINGFSSLDANQVSFITRTRLGLLDSP